MSAADAEVEGAGGLHVEAGEVFDEVAGGRVATIIRVVSSKEFIGKALILRILLHGGLVVVHGIGHKLIGDQVLLYFHLLDVARVCQGHVSASLPHFIPNSQIPYLGHITINKI